MNTTLVLSVLVSVGSHAQQPLDGGSATRWEARTGWVKEAPATFGVTDEGGLLVFSATGAGTEMPFQITLRPEEIGAESRYIAVRYRAEGLESGTDNYFIHGWEGTTGGRRYAGSNEVDSDGEWHVLATDLVEVMAQNATTQLGVKVIVGPAGTAKLTIEKLWFTDEVPPGATVGDVGAKEVRSVTLDWTANDPNTVNIDSLTQYAGRYNPLDNLRLESVYPVVQGYKDFASFGLRMNIGDYIGFHRLRMSATYSPSESLPKDERLHANFQYGYRSLTVDGNYNGADFYDLLGPTKTSRKGYGLGVRYRKNLLFDTPRSLHFSVGAAGYGGLERLPSYQNVETSSAELYKASTSLEYANLTNSIGGINKEKGIGWSLNAGGNYVNNELYPRISADVHVGVALPIAHTSVWLHASSGKSFGKIEEPAANFYFGGFRNNWVDNQDEKQYQGAIAFPGLEIDEIGGSNYAKLMAELVLPPVRFRRVGGTNMFLKWARISLFSSGLMTNVDRKFDSEEVLTRRRAVNVGGQVDLRIMIFSKFRTTLSFGYAVAQEREGKRQDETMVSLKIL